MYERCLNEAERTLAAQGADPIPVKDVWESVSHSALNSGFEIPALADFSALLEGDRRFEIIPASEDAEKNASGLFAEEEEEGELEKMGFFPEDRVRLRRFTPKPGPVGEEEEIVSLPRVAPSHAPKKPATPRKPAPRRPAARKPRKKPAVPARPNRTARRARKGSTSQRPSARGSRRRTNGRRGRKK